MEQGGGHARRHPSIQKSEIEGEILEITKNDLTNTRSIISQVGVDYSKLWITL